MTNTTAKGLESVPTTLVIVVFLLLALGISLVVLNVGSGILTGGFDSIAGLGDITDDIEMRQDAADSTEEQESESSDDQESTGTDQPDETRGGEYHIREGTAEETPVYVLEGDQSGPTVLIVGGLHGNEQNGWQAASNIASDGQIDAGTLVVIPQANIQAVEQDVRGAELEGAEHQADLNRHFPAGEEPLSLLAQEIWAVVEEHDPDLVLDLHSSRGLYDRTYEHECGESNGMIPNAVGMAVFPTQAGDAQQPSRDVVEYLNSNHWPDHLPTNWQFVYGGASPDGSSPMLKHKVGADRGTAAVIFETFDYHYDCVDLDTQVMWTEAAINYYLELYGLRD